MYDAKPQSLIKNLLNRYDNPKTESPSIFPSIEGAWKPVSSQR